MSQRYGRGFTAAEKTELWDRWQRGESLKAVGAVLVAFARFDTNTTVLTTIALIVAGTYSLPPLRLKERGILGWISSSIARARSRWSIP